MEEPKDLEYYEVKPEEEEEIEISIDEMKEMMNEEKIIRVIDAILEQAILEKASEIHIDFYVKYKMNDVLQEVMKPPTYASKVIITRIKYLANLNIDKINVTQEGKFSFQNDGKEYEAYVNITPGEIWEKAVIKIMEKI